MYASTLEELRKKEEDIHRDQMDGIDYAGGSITVAQLTERYINMKRNWKENTRRAHYTDIRRLQNDPFGAMMIRKVKLSDAKIWCIALHDRGLRRNTIESILGVVRPAFEMAVDDDLIRKNPFKFKLCDLLNDDAVKRVALTPEEQEEYLRFIREYGDSGYYNEMVILLGTGMRVSELYGLTRNDIDLERRCIHVRKQLCRTAEKPYFITEPKTKSGIRNIPMSDSVYMAIVQTIKDIPKRKVETIIDGCGGFLFLDQNLKPKVGMHLQNYMRTIRKAHPWVLGPDFPVVTPHVLRHTFCTNLQQSGIDVKSLQYLMGHSNASVTLDVYTHTDYNVVKRAFEQAVSGN